MADQEHDVKGYNPQENEEADKRNENEAADFTEETSAELAAPVSFDRDRETADERDSEEASAGRGVGISALVLSIISLFVLPVLFGAAGIVLGFAARRRGSESLGNWAIGIGAVSIIIGMFILPFF